LKGKWVEAKGNEGDGSGREEERDIRQKRKNFKGRGGREERKERNERGKGRKEVVPLVFQNAVAPLPKPSRRWTR